MISGDTTNMSGVIADLGIAIGRAQDAVRARPADASSSGAWQHALEQAQGLGENEAQTATRRALRPLPQPFVMTRPTGAGQDQGKPSNEDVETTQAPGSSTSTIGHEASRFDSTFEAAPADSPSVAQPEEVAIAAVTDTSNLDGLTVLSIPGDSTQRPTGVDAEADSLAPPARTALLELGRNSATLASEPEESSTEQSAVNQAQDDASVTAEHDPLRVHTQWSAEGVRVWLGADAIQPSSLNVVTQQLRQSVAGRGERLLSLVCNGQVVYGELDSQPTLESTKEHP